MFTLLLILMQNSSSGMAGGGVRGKVVGIARVTITGAGAVIIMFQVFILILTPIGEDTTETAIGTGTGGTMNGFLTNGFSGTGRAGKIIDVGKGKELGASRAINLDHNNRDRNLDNKDNSTINKDLMFKNRDSIRFSSHGDNLRSSNKDNNISKKFSNHSTLSLRENPKEGGKKNRIENRRTKNHPTRRKVLQMKKIRWMLGVLVCMFLIAVVIVPPSSASDEPAMVVGRVFYIKGDLLRYVPEENDWVAVVRDAPFSTEDTLFSGSRGMAELIIPNGTWIRIGNSTQIQVIAFDPDLSEMDVASGVARFYNKSSDTVVKVRSPFGYVIAYPDTVFDFYVGENSVEVVAIKGSVDFVHAETDTRYDVPAGSPSILADQRQVSSGEGIADPDWNRWNALRENFWASKARVRGRSVDYLPPSLRDDAYALDENGSWESVPYEGTSRWFWRPRVVAGWSPFTVGRWTDWYGDQTWIPAEPFGYVTHHYGNWVYMRNYWYWAPPVLSVRVGFPLLDVGFYWYPGRVSWIHTGTYVGWVPLAPRETYYSYHHWGGPHAVVVSNVSINQINVNVRNYAYVNRAIVIKQNNFYGVNNYTKVRVTNINPTAIINSYRAAPVVNNTVINNYTTIKQRYNYTTVKFNEKPHNTVINRIQQNKTIIREGKKEKASVVQQQVKSIPEGRVNREVQIEMPKAANYIVPAGEVNRPKSEIKLQQKEIKSRGEGAAKARPGVAGKPVQQPAQPAVLPGRVAPATPSQQEKPGKPAVPERVSPAKPARSVQPAARPGRVAPATPSQQEKPGKPAVPERVSPAKPAQSVQPASRPGRVAPIKPQETIKPLENKVVEKPKDQRPVQKQIDKPKEQRPSAKDVEMRRDRKDPNEEEGKPNK